MDRQNKPRSREKKVVDSGKGVEKQGEGLGTGPVNSAGNYEERRKQEQARQEQAARRTGPAQPFQQPQRPQQPSQPAAQRPGQGMPFGNASQRPTGGTPFPFGGQQARPQQSQQNQQAQRPQQSQQTQQTGPRVHYGSAQQTGSGARQNGTGQQGPTRSGGGSKLIMIVVALVVLFGGGKLTGLFGGNSSDLQLPSAQPTAYTGQQPSGGTDLLQSGGLSDLLSSFLGSSGSSIYDFLPTGGVSTGTQTSQTGGLTGGGLMGNLSSYFSSEGGTNSSKPDQTVASGARKKRTVIRGGGKDTVTVLVYMIGSDLESQNGMGTADLKEMTKASLSDKVNLIVYTGGARSWKNKVVSSSVQQIYQVKEGGLYRLEDDMGSAAMTKPATLAKFIQYGAKNFAADRMCLILWDHGGGSVSGYGRDERNSSAGSMSLAGINTALKDGGVNFDFVGFDACLMATVENGIMLEKYADYMIASEETEPGVGWYYTNWLNALSKNTSMPTVDLGKQIADDFVAVCNQQCRGQATTLSVVDLAELAATVPAELKDFSQDTIAMIRDKKYQQVSTARSRTREFAQSARIDQVDLVHFARNMGTKEGEELAKALEGAVKYNRTGGSISNAYGLSIYFPYKQVGKVNQAVSAFQAIGMDSEYTRCIQEFASLEVSGQVVSGTPLSSYGSATPSAMPGMLGSLLGGGGFSSSAGDGDLMDSLLGSLMGGGSSGGDLFSFLSGRSMTEEETRNYILENHFDETQLSWVDGRIHLSSEQWKMVESLYLNVFYDDGKGFIDLGLDPVYTTDGDDLLADFDGTWISINRQPVAYYYLNTAEEGENYAITGYVPVKLNGVRANLILVFDSERPEGYIAGAQPVYPGDENGTLPKMLIGIGEGDRLEFLCDYFDYEGNYQDTYRLGDPMVLGAEVEIANTPIDAAKARVTWCFTDLYQQSYWTPALTGADFGR